MILSATDSEGVQHRYLSCFTVTYDVDHVRFIGCLEILKHGPQLPFSGDMVEGPSPVVESVSQPMTLMRAFQM